MRWLVTGGSGFIGQRLCANLLAHDFSVNATTRRTDNPAVDRLGTVNWVPIADLATSELPATLFEDVDVVVHLAGLAHLRQVTPDVRQAFQRTNVDATLRVAERAHAGGVQRFVFLSTVKVLGEHTEPGQPFHGNSRPGPIGAYARSKADAEMALEALARRLGLELVIVRTPLVYGEGVKGNFLTLMNWINRGCPLPFAALRNARSLVALDNLVDLLRQCGTHPGAANQRFLVSDDADLSTPELIRRLARVMGQPPRLFALPPTLLTSFARMVGQADAMSRLTGNLQVDISHVKDCLGWRPVVSVDQGIADAVRALQRQQ